MKNCPEIWEIEAYIANQLNAQDDIEKIAEHLEICLYCKNITSELKQYLSIFAEEIKMPADNSIFQLISEIEKKRVVIAGILLQTKEKLKEQKAVSYNSRIILSTENDDSTILEDLDCIPLDKSEILIRAVQLHSNSDTTLYLFTENKQLYQNIGFQIASESKIFFSDDVGKIELGNFNIKNLDEQQVHIFFSNTN